MIGYFGVTLFLSEYCGFNIPKNLDKVKNSYISCIAKMVKMSFWAFPTRKKLTSGRYEKYEFPIKIRNFLPLKI